MCNMNPKDAILKLLDMSWTPAQIAAQAGISMATVSRIKHGYMQPTYASGVALVEMAKRGRKPARKRA